MKSIKNLIKENVKNLKPCIHGGEVLEAADKSGFKYEQILDFSSSVNPLGPSIKALNAAKNSFNEISAYPDSYADELRSAIANHYCLKSSNIIVGNGSTELMYLFAEVFLRKDDVALIPAPTFGEYECAVRKAGEAPRFVDLDKTFNLNTSELRQKMAGAKIVFLCNPNNPTSLLIPHSNLMEILETALRQDCLVFLDEDFLEFVESEKELTMIPRIADFPNLFILRSFTKIYGLTGLRVGYGIASEEIVEVLLRAKIPWNVNCLAQAAAVAALKDEEHLRITRELIRKEKVNVSAELSKLKGLKVYGSDANFYFINIRELGKTAAELADELLRQGILIRDCTSFRGLDPYYVRVAVKTHVENERLIESLKRTVNR
jgi:threonine-phosphate decarboxylase